jgi:hypothetical protein
MFEKSIIVTRGRFLQNELGVNLKSPSLGIVSMKVCVL